MSFAYLADPSGRPAWQGTLPGKRFFQHMGQPADHGTTEQPPFVPDFPRMQAAAQQHNMQFMPQHTWDSPEA